VGAIGRTIVLSGLVLAGFSLPAMANCPCPKSQMIELYGSVSMYPKQLPGPRLHQPQRTHVKPVVPVTTLPSMADVAKAMPTPTLDKMANPLLWDPIFVLRQ
jgi:hypothetical protein